MKKRICPKCSFLDLEGEGTVCSHCGYVFPQDSNADAHVQKEASEPSIVDSILIFEPPVPLEKDNVPSSPNDVTYDIRIHTGEISDPTPSVAEPGANASLTVENEPFSSSPPIPSAEPGQPTMPLLVRGADSKFRLVAAIIDVSIVVVLTVIFWVIAKAIAGFTGTIFEPKSPLWVPFLCLFLFLWFLYYGWFDGIAGTSPGKALFYLRVVDKSGASVGFLKGALRSFLSFFLTLFFGFGGALTLLAKSGRGPHDLIMRTFVVELKD